MKTIPGIAALSRVACIAVILSMSLPQGCAANDIAVLKQRMTKELLASTNPQRASDLLETMREDGTWTDVPYNDKGPGNWKAAQHLNNVLTMVRWYRSMKAVTPEKKNLQDAVFSSLDYWLENDPENSNWWWNVIGIPRRMADICLLMDDDLDGWRREKALEITARGKLSMTGANLADVASISIARGIVERNEELIAKAVGLMVGEIKVSLGEGIQPDFSFHQHGALLYNHGYGAVFLSNCAELANLVKDTAFAFPPEKIELVCRLILEGNQWMIRYGTKDYGATGRGITRPSGKSHSAGYLKPIIRDMLTLSTHHEPEFRNIIIRMDGTVNAPLIGNRHYWRSDYMVHHRERYFMSVRMFSNRLFNTDGPSNQEGLKSHHLSDGCTYIMKLGLEYQDIFPVWDWQKIPGTTVEQTPELQGDIKVKGTTSFVGGVSNGYYGVAAFDMERFGLRARKSWFFFEGEMICLGTGINCDSEYPVVTTMNQCHLAGDVAISMQGDLNLLEQGSHTINNVDWVYHDRIGYVFPEPASLHLDNEERSGSWWDINHVYSKDTVKEDVFTLWTDHGSSPHNAEYAYIVLPYAEWERVKSYADNTPVRILSNEPGCQAVMRGDPTIIGIAFYEPKTLTVYNGMSVTVDKPCLLLMRDYGSEVEITASNPENKGMTLTVTLQGPQTDRTVIMQLPDGMNAGSSVTMRIAK